jgi:hypothetical protein
VPATDEQPDLLQVSQKFWIYWAFAIPFTVVTVVAWLFWLRYWVGNVDEPALRGDVKTASIKRGKSSRSLGTTF